MDDENEYKYEEYDWIIFTTLNHWNIIFLGWIEIHPRISIQGICFISWIEPLFLAYHQRDHWR
jgi:hypothetical protein